MRTLPRPPFEARAVFKSCIGSVRDRDLSRRLNAVLDDVETAEKKYVGLAKKRELHDFPRNTRVGGFVNTSEMTSVYTDRFVPKRSGGREVYDAIVAAAPLGRCPTCAVGQVSTLDHYLPKAHYPVLSVTPDNLVPSCMWCQGAKMQDFPVNAEDQTLHPYFDNCDGARWLVATVIKTSPAAFTFSAQRPEGWEKLTMSRLKNHMRSFQLGRLYASNAAEELTNIRYSLQQLMDVGGSQAVRDHLRGEAESRQRAFKNSWQTAMYFAASECDWFCKGGFAND